MGLKQILQALLLLAVAALTSACSTGPAAPTESYDGLVLVPDTRLGVVYKRPGADLTGYDSYGLMACEVVQRPPQGHGYAPAQESQNPGKDLSALGVPVDR